jgi:hypothetical protein
LWDNRSATPGSSNCPGDPNTSVSPLPLDTNTRLLPQPITPLPSGHPEPIQLEANLWTNLHIGWSNAERLRHLVETSIQKLSLTKNFNGPPGPLISVGPRDAGRCPSPVRPWPTSKRSSSAPARLGDDARERRQRSREQVVPARTAECTDPPMSKRRRRRLARLDYLASVVVNAPSNEEIEASLKEVAARQR